jgi:hypothetical protein
MELDQIRAEAEAEIFGEDPQGEQQTDPEVKEPEKKPEPKEEPKAEPKEELKEPKEDPWAGVSPALREQFEGVTRKLSTLDEITNRLKTAEGRVGALQSELAKKATHEVKQAPSAAQIDAAASDAEWEELKEDFPEWANALEKRLTATRDDVKSLIATEQKRMTEEVERRIVSIKHPGYQKTIQDPAFKTWFSAQPAEIQKLANSMRAEDAIKVLDGYAGSKTEKVEKAPSRMQDRKKRLQDAAMIPRGSPQKPIKSEADMTEAELRKKIASEIWET